MERNSPINSVYLIALATCSLISVVYSFNFGLVFAIVSVAAYLFSISIVAMVEKIADKNVRFLMFVFISAAFIVLLKVLTKYINVPTFIQSSKVIDFAILPAIMMAIVSIYFEDTLTVKQFFLHALIMSAAFVLMVLIYSGLTEILGYGTFLGKTISANFTGIEFFRMPYGSLMMIATLTILFNIVRRAYLKTTRKFNMLVEKYKVIIHGIMDSEKALEEEDKK